MEDSRVTAEPVCAQEAIDLLNCIAEPSFDESKCLALVNSLRQCIVNKKVKKFSIVDRGREEAKLSDKKT